MKNVEKLQSGDNFSGIRNNFQKVLWATNENGDNSVENLNMWTTYFD